MAQTRPLRFEVHLILPAGGQGGGLHNVAALFFEIGLILSRWGEVIDRKDKTTSFIGEFDTFT